MNWGLYVFAFVALFATDVTWVVYMGSVADKRPWLSAALAALLYVVGGLTVLAYLQEPGVLVSGGLGAAAGTWVGVTLKDKYGGGKS